MNHVNLTISTKITKIKLNHAYLFYHKAHHHRILLFSLPLSITNKTLFLSLLYSLSLSLPNFCGGSLSTSTSSPLLRLRFGSIDLFFWVGLFAMVAQQPQLQIQTQQPTPSPQDEALKRNTDCVYFLASPLTCKKVLFFFYLFLKSPFFLYQLYLLGFQIRISFGFSIF